MIDCKDRDEKEKETFGNLSPIYKLRWLYRNLHDISMDKEKGPRSKKFRSIAIKSF